MARAGRGGGSRRTKLKRDRWAPIVFRLGAAHVKGANRLGAARPPPCLAPARGAGTLLATMAHRSDRKPLLTGAKSLTSPGLCNGSR
jgi:hypothetical protein